MDWAYNFQLPFSVDIGKRKKIMLQLAPSLNVMLRESPFTRDKRKKVLKELLTKQITPMYRLDEVHVHFTRVGLKLLDPIDNMGASFKCIGDALVESGYLMDDSELIIKSVHPEQVRCKHRADQQILVNITGKYFEL